MISMEKLFHLNDIIFSSITLLYPSGKQSILMVERCDLENGTVCMHCSSGVILLWSVEEKSFISSDGTETQGVTVFINVDHNNDDGEYTEDYYFPTKEKNI